MTVSLCVIAYNEEALIRGLLDDISKQDYPHDLMEVVFVDNGSDDTTGELLGSFAKINTDFLRVCVRTQEKSNQAHGWNTALCSAFGDIIIRIDAHARIPHNYVSCCVKEIENGEDIVGGGRPCIAQRKSKWNDTLLAAEECMFGSSIMGYRRKQKKKRYLSSLFHAAYKREVFSKVGGFNEYLGRTEDNELHYRMRKAGYKLACCPSISSTQYMRTSFSSMCNQKFSNGLWIGLTCIVCPACLSVLHFAPFCLVAAAVAAGIAAALGYTLWVILLAAAYILFDIAISISAMRAGGMNVTKLLLPVLFPLLHISYGLGTLFGLIGMVPWRLTRRGSAKKKIRAVRNTIRRNTIE